MPCDLTQQNDIRMVVNGQHAWSTPQHPAAEWPRLVMRGVTGRLSEAAHRAARLWGLIAMLPLIGSVLASPALAEGQGCRSDVDGKIGAQVTAQVLRPGQDGRLAAIGAPATEVAARAGDTVRLSARPVEGTFQPAGPDCPIRVSVGKL